MTSLPFKRLNPITGIAISKIDIIIEDELVNLVERVAYRRMKLHRPQHSENGVDAIYVVDKETMNFLLVFYNPKYKDWQVDSFQSNVKEINLLTDPIKEETGKEAWHDYIMPEPRTKT